MLRRQSCLTLKQSKACIPSIQHPHQTSACVPYQDCVFAENGPVTSENKASDAVKTPYISLIILRFAQLYNILDIHMYTVPLRQLSAAVGKYKV